MSNKQERERKEMQNLFADPRFCRQAWKSVGLAILQSPATKPFCNSGKEGLDTYEDLVEQYGYNALKRDIDSLSKEKREPTQLEMILQCQAIHARHNPTSAAFIRDTVGAKPIDESKVEQRNINQYETLTDEELEVLQQYREQQKAIAASTDEDSASPPAPADDTLQNLEGGNMHG